MKEIPLTQGKVALVDDEDYERVNAFKWYVRKSRNNYYAARSEYLGKINGKYKSIVIHMHRFVLNADVEIDHKNGNTLDNTRKNLRIATISQNNANLHGLKNNNTSGFRGVTKRNDAKGLNIWRARIYINGIRKTIGHFLTPEEAARAFDKAAKEIYGEFCGKLNFEDTLNKKE